MEEQTSSQEQSSSEQSQTLDQVYQQFNVEAEAQSFHPQKEQVQQQAAPVQQNPAVPDPVLDPSGYKAWSSQQSQFVQQALSQIQGKLSQFERERLVQREEADIKSAVQQFKTVVGDVDEDIAEVALGQKARKDPKFLTVYQNRSKNPQAWNAAVKAYANEFKGKNQFKVDPQIAENQRAAKQSIQGSQTTQQKEEPSGDDARFKGKGGSAFTQEWSKYVNSSI